MLIPVRGRNKSLVTFSALVWTLASVDSYVNVEVALGGKRFLANGADPFRDHRKHVQFSMGTQIKDELSTYGA